MRGLILDHVPYAGDIAREAIKYNLISCQGKTPEATMASALYTDLKRKESASIFIRPHEGLFGLREWLDKDFKMEVGHICCAMMSCMHDSFWNICHANGREHFTPQCLNKGGDTHMA